MPHNFPYRILYLINSIIFFEYSFIHHPALFPTTDLNIREDVISLLDDLEGLLCTLGVSRVLVRMELGEGGLLVAQCKAECSEPARCCWLEGGGGAP